MPEYIPDFAMLKPSMHWTIAPGHTLDVSSRALVMGILNVTPDSFSDGGAWPTVDAAVTRACEMLDQGAAIIDIGGQSTRPGAPDVSAEEELARTIPVVSAILSARPDAILSIDTMKACVAAAALTAGARILNDVSGLTADPEMTAVARDHRCGVVVMHMRGTPATMQQDPRYNDVTAEVAAWLADRHRQLTADGIAPGSLVYDPGIGFGKTQQHNLELLANLDRLAPAGRPLLIGVSRKSVIARTQGLGPDADREAATTALTAHARLRGARIHRVHEIPANHQALRMIEAILGDEPPS